MSFARGTGKSGKAPQRQSSASGLSSGTQDLLNNMMKQSGLRPEQMKHIKSSVNNRVTLPLNVPREGTYAPSREAGRKAPQRYNFGARKSGLSIQGEMEAERQQQRLQRKVYKVGTSVDPDRQKQELQHYMERGTRSKPYDVRKKKPSALVAEESPVERVDRFKEVEEEVEERVKYMEEMQAVGAWSSEQESKIMGEIGALRGEMLKIDKARKQDPDAFFY